MKVRLNGGDDPKKPIKIKTNKPTAAELEAANILAKDIAVRKGLISGESTHVGGEIPKFYDARTGKELVAVIIPPPVGKLSNKVPLYVKSLEWDADANLPYYIDEQTGDMQYVNKDLFHSPRFQSTRGTTPITSLVKR